MKALLHLILESPHRRYLMLFIILFTLYHIPSIISSISTPYIKSVLLTRVASEGLDIQLKSFNYQFPNRMNARSVILRPDLVPALYLDRIELAYIRMFTDPRVLIDAALYNGSISCSFESKRMIPALPLYSRCNVDHIHLESYPLAFALGVQGTISGVLEGNIDQTLSGSNTQFTITLSHGSFDTEKNQFTKLLNAGSFTSVEIFLEGNSEGDSLYITNASLSSSYGSITSVQGSISRISQATPVLSLQGKIKLTSEGKNILGSWIALLNNNKPLTSEITTLYIDGTINQPSVRFVPAG
jgi:hypothetical protein